MGLFKRFKQEKESEEGKKDRLKNILSQIDVNPYDYNHEDMESAEASLKEELAGALKISELTYEDGKNNFDYISITDYDNGFRDLYKSITNRDPRETKTLVDKFYEVLGSDSLNYGKFSSFDLELMETEEMFTLRSWHLTYFDLHIGFVNNENGETSYILVKEK